MSSTIDMPQHNTAHHSSLNTALPTLMYIRSSMYVYTSAVRTCVLFYSLFLFLFLFLLGLLMPDRYKHTYVHSTPYME